MRLTCLAALAALALPAAAAETGPPAAPMDADAFEAATVGRTLYYSAGGIGYGVEQYLPGRKVIWAFVGDDCREGEWYADGPYICFVYEHDPAPQCWTFEAGGQGLIARFRGDPDGVPLIAVQESPEPMACLGPDVGV